MGYETILYDVSGAVATMADARQITDRMVVTSPAVQQDIYAQYGISKYRADGTRKTEGELSAELKQAMIAKKRQANPNYGTIWNMGNIFSGE